MLVCQFFHDIPVQADAVHRDIHRRTEIRILQITCHREIINILIQFQLDHIPDRKRAFHIIRKEHFTRKQIPSRSFNVHNALFFIKSLSKKIVCIEIPLAFFAEFCDHIQLRGHLILGNMFIFLKRLFRNPAGSRIIGSIEHHIRAVHLFKFGIQHVPDPGHSGYTVKDHQCRQKGQKQEGDHIPFLLFHIIFCNDK